MHKSKLNDIIRLKALKPAGSWRKMSQVKIEETPITSVNQLVRQMEAQLKQIEINQERAQPPKPAQRRRNQVTPEDAVFPLSISVTSEEEEVAAMGTIDFIETNNIEETIGSDSADEDWGDESLIFQTIEEEGEDEIVVIDSMLTTDPEEGREVIEAKGGGAASSAPETEVGRETKLSPDSAESLTEIINDLDEMGKFSVAKIRTHGASCFYILIRNENGLQPRTIRNFRVDYEAADAAEAAKKEAEKQNIKVTNLWAKEKRKWEVRRERKWKIVK